MMQEQWKDIPGYEGLYQASDLQNVKSLPREISWSNQFGVKGKTTRKGSFVKPYLNSRGYLLIKLSKSGVAKAFSLHRIIAGLFVPNPENLPEVNHKFGVKTDCRATELEWTTSKQNTAHAIQTGLRKSFGATHYKTKFSIDDVRRIKNGNESGSDLARHFGVHPSTIGKIRNGNNWANA